MAHCHCYTASLDSPDILILAGAKDGRRLWCAAAMVELESKAAACYWRCQSSKKNHQKPSHPRHDFFSGAARLRCFHCSPNQAIVIAIPLWIWLSGKILANIIALHCLHDPSFWCQGLLQLTISWKCAWHAYICCCSSDNIVLATDLWQNSTSSDFLQAVSLKAELEASRGNLRRAGKLMTNRSPEAEPLQGLEEVQVLCNMAYVQHQEGKFHTAVLCYSKALKLASQNKAALIPLVRSNLYEFWKIYDIGSFIGLKRSLAARISLCQKMKLQCLRIYLQYVTQACLLCKCYLI